MYVNIIMYFVYNNLIENKQIVPQNEKISQKISINVFKVFLGKDLFYRPGFTNFQFLTSKFS